MSLSLPVWRSMLFVPAHVERFVSRAHERGADACILDLEDSVPPTQKSAARAALASAAVQVSRSGGGVLVRVNRSGELLLDDLQAAVLPEVQAVVLPKVDSAALLRDVAARLDQLEAACGVASGRIRLIAQIEDVRALPHLDEIAASSQRLLGMILGSEDFCASAGMAPVREALLWPNQQVVFACRRAGILPFGFPGSIADFSDLEAFRSTIRLARQLGFVGAFCVHPAQVAVLNQEFVPAPAEVEEARAVLTTYEAALREGRAAASYNGKMIDPPVVARAKEILHRAGAVH
ncbi:MAG: CoA ester lyase [Sinobacteraceae bacterium]|nr:CoA ester lyase [Nevskiaceae bacterium]